MQQSIEAAEVGFDALAELVEIVRGGAFEVERVQDRFRANGPGRVVHPVQRGDLAPEQHHRRAGLGAGHGRGRAQATGGAGDQDDAALKRQSAAHAFCASATIRASSPDSESSTVMSQPPISSPLMNSCGKVGQSE